ncbi:hypothetical protein P4H94_28295, partial [Paenibacillus macerans]|uniref:hypothetical protein n=1 Tax=Paenibacillus macerans TaxID=44252 RepID=UPI002DB98F05
GEAGTNRRARRVHKPPEAARPFGARRVHGPGVSLELAPLPQGRISGEMQKCMRLLSKLLNVGSSNANVQFISSQKILFDQFDDFQMHFCISSAHKGNFV